MQILLLVVFSFYPGKSSWWGKRLYQHLKGMKKVSNFLVSRGPHMQVSDKHVLNK